MYEPVLESKINLELIAFHSCCLSHHVFDQVTLWVGIETAVIWHCSPGTVETLSAAPRTSKAVITGYKTQHSYPRSRLITWRRPEVKFGRNVVREKKKNNKKLPRWGQEIVIKIELILRLRRLISERIPKKDN